MLQPHSYQPPEDGLPPEQVRIQALRAEPWPEDGRRVRVHLDVTPFQERPNIEVSIAGESGQEAANVTIIESIDAHMVFTMHIRGNHPSGRFTLSASLAYPEIGVVDQKSEVFETAVEG
jgi:hypothetical protein